MKFEAIEKFIRATANQVGLDIHRYRPATTQAGRLAAMLAHHEVNLVLDIGANTGQFASALRRAGYRSRIVSFEPLAAEHALLVHASNGDVLWEVASRTAVGDVDGTIEIHVSRNSFSSSALRMLDSHTRAAPDSEYCASETVPLARLDTLATRYLTPDTVTFMKIDTQGFEDRVLDGATSLIERTSGLQLELSFVALYDGQKLFETLVKRLCDLGFSIWAIWPGVCSPDTGRMLQTDVVFFRR